MSDCGISVYPVPIAKTMIVSSTNDHVFVSRYGQLIVGQYLEQILCKFDYSNSTHDVTATTSGTGATSNANAMATVSCGAGVGLGKLVSTRYVAYRPAHEVHTYFTALFSSGQDANTYQRIGLYDITEGFWLGYSGTSFGVAYRTGTTDTFIASISFNKDKLDGTGSSGFTLDTTKLNQYKINYGWLGAAPITYSVYGGNSLGWIVFHVIDPTNTLTVPITLSPSNPITMEAGRTSGAGAVTLSTASWNAGTVQGEHTHAGHRVFASKISATLSAGVTSYVVTFQNKTTYQSKTNKVLIQATLIGIATDGTKTVTFDFYKNSTLTGTSYTDVDTANSVCSYDVAGTISANGKYELSIPLAKIDSRVIDVGVGHVHLELEPGETMTISAVSAAANDVVISFRWEEYFS